jgi:hypothetical protein
MTEHESLDRTIHVKDPNLDHGAAEHDAVHEGTDEADAQDPSVGGSSDGDTSA